MNAVEPERLIYSGHPCWRSMLDFHLGGVLLALAGGALARLATKDWGLAIAVWAGLMALSLAVGAMRRASLHYTVTDRRLRIRRGLLSRTEQQTTIDRVQNIETHQSLLERILRIGTIDFDTAATEDSRFAFIGIATPKQVVASIDRAQQVTDRAEPVGRR